MTSIRDKRIRKDIRDLIKSGLIDGKNGIYVRPDEFDITKMTAMIIGPEGTPYQDGFYFFDIKFPTNYPMKNPDVKFCTLNPYVRFNPNLYTEGKVCLSLLGTWAGPGWTACNNVGSILLSIQSMVLNEEPLKNEPGFETASNRRLEQYRLVVEYYNYLVAVHDMMHSPPGIFGIFKDEMIVYFYNNFDKYITKINELRDNIEKKTHLYPNYKKTGIIDAGVYQMKAKPNFDELLVKLISFKESLDGFSKSPKNMVIKSIATELTQFSSMLLVCDIASKLKIPIKKDEGKEDKTKKQLIQEIEEHLEIE